jgi:hypothetical protein
MAATEFQDRCLKPLGHPSKAGKSDTYLPWRENISGLCYRIATNCFAVLRLSEVRQGCVDRVGRFVVPLPKQVRVDFESDVGRDGTGPALAGSGRFDSLVFAAPLLDLRFVHRLAAEVV